MLNVVNVVVIFLFQREILRSPLGQRLAGGHDLLPDATLGLLGHYAHAPQRKGEHGQGVDEPSQDWKKERK